MLNSVSRTNEINPQTHSSLMLLYGIEAFIIVFENNLSSGLILQILFEESELILFLIIIVLFIKKLLTLSAKSSADVKRRRYKFELLPIKFRVNLKNFFWFFKHLWNRNTCPWRVVFFYRDPYIKPSVPLRKFSARFSLLSSKIFWADLISGLNVIIF